MNRIELTILRDGLTSTSVNMDCFGLNFIQRWIASSVRLSGNDAGRYHFVAYCNIADISGTDTLEELTGGITGSTFRIINKRECTGSHLEFDLEPIHAG